MEVRDTIHSKGTHVKLGDVALINMGQSPPSANYNTDGIGLPFFQGKSEFAEIHPVATKWCSKPKKVAQPNDILMSVRAPVGATNIADQQCCIGRGLAAIRFDGDNRFLLYYFKLIEQDLDQKGTGTTFKAISGKVLKDLVVPYPPLPEQRRIVAKIEALFSEVDAGVEKLKASKEQLRTYRQAVLKAAFEGTWEKVKLGEVSEMCLGKMLDKKKNKGSYQPYLRNINVRWGGFELDDLLEMRFEKHEEERYSLKKGDLVICEGGEPGRAAIWPQERGSIKIQKALHRVRLAKNVSGEFLLYHLMLSAQNGQLSKYFTGTTIKHLTGRQLRRYEFSCPSFDEQKRIVQEIKRCFRLSDGMVKDIKSSLERVHVLRQGILKKAFEGSLLESTIE